MTGHSDIGQRGGRHALAVMVAVVTLGGCERSFGMVCSCSQSPGGCEFPPVAGSTSTEQDWASLCTVINGNIVINSAMTMMAEAIVGNISISSQMTGTVSFPLLQSVVGKITASTGSSGSFQAPRLLCIGLPLNGGAEYIDAISLYQSTTSLYLNPDGVNVLGSINLFQVNPPFEMTTMFLRTVSGNIRFFQSNVNASFPALTTINSSILINQGGSGVLNLPALTFLGGIEAFQNSVVFHMPSLVKLGPAGVNFGMGHVFTGDVFGHLTNLSGTGSPCVDDSGSPIQSTFTPLCNANFDPEGLVTTCSGAGGDYFGGSGGVEKLSAGDDVGITLAVLAVLAAAAVVGLYAFQQRQLLGRDRMEMNGGNII